MLEPDVTVGMTLTGALTPAGLGMAALIPLIESGLRRLDHLHRRESLPRHALRPRPRDAPRQSRRSPTSCCARKASSASTTSSSTTTCCSSTDAFFRKIMQGPEFQRAMSSAEFHCALRQVRARAREGARHRPEVAALGRVSGRRADLHVVARRLVDRHERRRARARGEQAASIDPNHGRERDGVDRARREARRRQAAPC